MCCSWVWAVVATSFNVKFMKLGALDAGVLLSLQNYRGEQDDITMLFKVKLNKPPSFVATTTTTD